MRLDLAIDRRTGRAPRALDVRALFNMGSAVRDPAFARHHQEEVERAGIANPTTPPPWLFPLAPFALVTDTAIAVQGTGTSGEAEVVVVLDDELYVGVGSDHTDRELERTSVQWSKQVCPNVLAPVLWPYAEVAGHWDRCRLSCHAEGALYQDTSVAVFLKPPDIVEVLRARVPALPDRGVVVFCGTVSALDGAIRFGGRDWRVALEDPVLGRAIAHGYSVTTLLDGIDPRHRIPLPNAR